MKFIHKSRFEVITKVLLRLSILKERALIQNQALQEEYTTTNQTNNFFATAINCLHELCKIYLKQIFTHHQTIHLIFIAKCLNALLFIHVQLQYLRQQHIHEACACLTYTCKCLGLGNHIFNGIQHVFQRAVLSPNTYH